MARSLLVLTGGHPYEEAPFANLIGNLGGWEVTHLIHPDGSEADAAGAIVTADALLFCDMAGHSFGDGPPTYANPHVRQMLAQALDYTSGEAT